jgi:hypothetical protein
MMVLDGPSFPLSSSVIFKLGHLKVPGGTVWDSHEKAAPSQTQSPTPFSKILPPFT